MPRRYSAYARKLEMRLHNNARTKGVFCGKQIAHKIRTHSAHRFAKHAPVYQRATPHLFIGFICTCEMHLSNGKAVPLQAWTGPEGSRKVRLPQISWQWHRMVVGCQPYAPAAFYPQEILPVLISVRPQGHSAIGRILCQWKIHWHQLGSNQRPSDL